MKDNIKQNPKVPPQTITYSVRLSIKITRPKHDNKMTKCNRKKTNNRNRLIDDPDMILKLSGTGFKICLHTLWPIEQIQPAA